MISAVLCISTDTVLCSTSNLFNHLSSNFISTDYYSHVSVPVISVLYVYHEHNKPSAVLGQYTWPVTVSHVH